MSAMTAVVGSLFSSTRAEAWIVSSNNKKPVKLNIIATLDKSDVTSKSAVIHVKGFVVDLKRMGKGKKLIIILCIEGHYGRYTLSIPDTHAVSDRDFNYKVPLSIETIRGRNDKPMDLFPGTEYDVTLRYAVIDIKTNKVKSYIASDVIAAMTFKTLPEKVRHAP
jgi:hypothetical protein